MFPSNTVFILGAGASKPYGMPLGYEINRFIIDLANDIRSINNRGNKNILAKDLLGISKELDYDNSEIITFSNALRKSNIYSIDRFLNVRKDDYEYLGKHIIAYLILKNEKAKNISSNGSDDDWLGYLWNKYIFQDSLDKIQNTNVSFLTFNYDRIVEYFLTNSISETFGVSNVKSVEIMDSIPILHIYGQVGFIYKEPRIMQDRDFFTDFIPLEGDVDFTAITRASKSIKLIYETRSNKKIMDGIRDTLEKAESIYFLGFGYDKMNLKILGLDDIDLSNKSIYGTAFGLVENEINKIRIGKGSTKPILKNMTSLELLRNYL